MDAEGHGVELSSRECTKLEQAIGDARSAIEQVSSHEDQRVVLILVTETK